MNYLITEPYDGSRVRVIASGKTQEQAERRYEARRRRERSEGQYFDERFLYMTWLNGFLSATNVNSSTDIRSDRAAIDVWMRRWCEQNPTKSVVAAALVFVWDQGGEFPSEQAQQRSPKAQW